jgi:hypothetical protein
MVQSDFNYINELEFFSPVGGSSFPYLPEPIFVDNVYHVYEGVTGENRYRYLEIRKDSEDGRQCANFIEKYFVQNHVRHNFYEDGSALLEKIKGSAINYLDGFPAYQKYWREALTGNQQMEKPFYVIPFFDSLTDWFTLRLARHATESQDHLRSASTRTAHQRKWIRDLHAKVSQYIEASKITPSQTISSISAEHAGELLRFRDWLKTFLENPGTKPITLADFILDFEVKDRTLESIGSIDNNDVKIFYLLNKRQYSILHFWIFLKDFHVEKAMEYDDHAKRLTYFERIVHQLKVASNQDYERFVLEKEVPPEIAEEVHNRSKRVIEDIEHRIQDLYRYFKERGTVTDLSKNNNNEEANQHLRTVPRLGDLLHGSSIPEPVLDAFYSLTQQPRDPEQIPKGYIGKLKHFSYPFTKIGENTYILNQFWELHEAKVLDGYYTRLGVSDNEINEGLDIYREAFIRGYHTFESEYLEENIGIFKETSDKESFIFEYATEPFTSWGNFSEQYGVQRDLLSNWVDDGLHGGYFYRAWYNILRSGKRFELKFGPNNDENGLVAQASSGSNHDPVDKIIVAIDHAGKMALQYTSLYRGKNEEEIRDLFIFGLNNSDLQPITATAEAYNHRGKTDINFKKTNNETIFVAECKIWHGSENMLDAIDQLIERYVSWPLTRSAVLLFVTIPSFTRVYKAIKENLNKNQYFKELISTNSDRSCTALFRHANDPDRLIQLEIIGFPFPQIDPE